MADPTLRPPVPLEHADEREHRRLLANRTNASMTKDGTQQMGAPLRVQSVAVADLPAAGDWTNSIIYVSNETGGATLAFSDGTNWRRAQDRAVVS